MTMFNYCFYFRLVDAHLMFLLFELMTGKYNIMDVLLLINYFHQHLVFCTFFRYLQYNIIPSMVRVTLDYEENCLSLLLLLLSLLFYSVTLEWFQFNLLLSWWFPKTYIYNSLSYRLYKHIPLIFDRLIYSFYDNVFSDYFLIY